MCWGANTKGQVGIGNSAITRIPVPVVVPGLTDIRQISSGADHACALRGDGTVWCWGESIYGQLSVASVTNHAPSPVQIPGVTTATQLTTGKYHTCVRTAAGGVRCWGANHPYGQVGGGPVSSLVTVAITGVSEVRAGGFHTCARLTTGAVSCWGWNQYGQSGGTPSVDSTLTPTTVAGISTARELALGESFSCARLSDGKAVCWGNGAQGQLGDGSSASSTTTPQQVIDLGTIVSLSAAPFTVCGAYADAAVRCWGSDFWGMFGDGGAGGGSNTPAPSGLGTARTVAMGGSSGCAIRTTGRVVCAGRNNEGQLGYGATALTPTPVSPNGL
jgi:alpha-tubulin suppressor-like RCC1 family protein